MRTYQIHTPAVHVSIGQALRNHPQASSLRVSQSLTQFTSFSVAHLEIGLNAHSPVSRAKVGKRGGKSTPNRSSFQDQTVTQQMKGGIAEKEAREVSH